MPEGRLDNVETIFVQPPELEPVIQPEIAKILVEYLSFIEAFGIMKTGIENATFSSECLKRTAKFAVLLKKAYIISFPA